MANITLPKTEYKKLRRQAAAYRQFAVKIFESAIRDPIEEVIEDFKKTNLYSGNFLKDLEFGLRKSSYAKKYENRSAERRS